VDVDNLGFSLHLCVSLPLLYRTDTATVTLSNKIAQMREQTGCVLPVGTRIFSNDSTNYSLNVSARETDAVELGHWDQVTMLPNKVLLL
jgi:hypothetical protein